MDKRLQLRPTTDYLSPGRKSLERVTLVRASEELHRRRDLKSNMYVPGQDVGSKKALEALVLSPWADLRLSANLAEW